jgi:hypothetical protein
MVKFSQDSHYYSIVRAKLLQILRSALQTQDGMENLTTTQNLPAVALDEVNERFVEANSQDPTGPRAEGIPKLKPRSITGTLNRKDPPDEVPLISTGSGFG